MQENLNAPILELDYSLNSQSAQSSIMEHHIAKSKTKTIVQIVILGAIALLFAVDAIVSFDKMDLFMIAVCFICIAFMIFTPRTQAKDMSAKFGEGKSFKLELYKNKVSISNGDTKTELDLSKSRICETQNFLYFESEKRMFSVPKSFFSEQQKADFREFVSQNNQISYKNYNKK